MPQQLEAEAKILRGLPVIVVGRVWPAEPDVGAAPSAEIDDICWPSGKSIPTRMWERLSDADYEACQEALLAADGDWDDGYADYAREMRLEREY